ncbi:hypothetical protein NEIG_02477 [Nematocida sp. ERTm5]|nr:hypothetical protein NEIG_02477 [Nematocida sp. ERTm5]
MEQDNVRFFPVKLRHTKTCSLLKYKNSYIVLIPIIHDSNTHITIPNDR